MNISLITFGAGDRKYIEAANRLQTEAINSGWFKRVKIWDLNEIALHDSEWSVQNSEFIKNNKRGSGYFIWKPKIIELALKQIPENEILVYLDAGCELCISPESTRRFLQYIDWTYHSELLAFYLNGFNYSVKQWTKKRLLEFFGLNKNQATILNSPQIEAGIIFLKNTPQIRKFILEWLNISTANNYVYIDDNVEIESTDFLEHRHDQSIFSLLVYLSNIGYIIRNENYLPDMWSKNLHPRQAPIAAFRNLSSCPMLLDKKLFPAI